MQCAGNKWLFARPCGGHAFTVRMNTTVSSGNANGKPSLASTQNLHLGSLMIRDAHWAHSSFLMLSIVLWVIILCRNYHKRVCRNTFLLITTFKSCEYHIYPQRSWSPKSSTLFSSLLTSSSKVANRNKDSYFKDFHSFVHRVQPANYCKH